MAAGDLYKEACRQPKTYNVMKKKSDKNKFTNVLGETKGKVFVQQQDIRTIALKKYFHDKVKKGDKNNKDDKDNKDNKDIKDIKDNKDNKVEAEDV